MNLSFFFGYRPPFTVLSVLYIKNGARKKGLKHRRCSQSMSVTWWHRVGSHYFFFSSGKTGAEGAAFSIWDLGRSFILLLDGAILFFLMVGLSLEIPLLVEVKGILRDFSNKKKNSNDEKNNG